MDRGLSSSAPLLTLWLSLLPPLFALPQTCPGLVSPQILCEYCFLCLKCSSLRCVSSPYVLNQTSPQRASPWPSPLMLLISFTLGCFFFFHSSYHNFYTSLILLIYCDYSFLFPQASMLVPQWGYLFVLFSDESQEHLMCSRGSISTVELEQCVSGGRWLGELTLHALKNPCIT